MIKRIKLKIKTEKLNEINKLYLTYTIEYLKWDKK